MLEHPKATECYLGDDLGDGTMDNQQERQLSKDFVGGIITGEGWFGLPVQKNGHLRLRLGFHITPRFCLQMNDKETMLAVSRSFNAWGIGHRIYTPPNGKSFRLEFAGHKRMMRLLDLILPHLYGKKKEAALVVKKFIDLRQSKPFRSPYGQEEFTLVDKLRWEVNDGRTIKRRFVSSETTCQTSAQMKADEDIVQP
jgi:hypothetical protein